MNTKKQVSYVLPKDKKYCIFCQYRVSPEDSGYKDDLCLAVNQSSCVGKYTELEKCKNININGDCVWYVEISKEERKKKAEEKKENITVDDLFDEAGKKMDQAFKKVDEIFKKFDKWLRTP